MIRLPMLALTVLVVIASGEIDVIVDGRPCAKVGRRLRPNPRLERVH